MECVALLAAIAFNQLKPSQEGLAPFVARVEGIVRKRLHYDSKLLFGPEATAQRELAQELDR